MSLYSLNDVNDLENSIESIIERFEYKRLQTLEPTLNEMKNVLEIIIEFIKKKKRKIYGGYALNLLIKNKNEHDMIYKPDKIADIDFYTPDPINDLVKLCNILHEKGFKNVMGREAQHQETYTLSVNFVNYCDLSYVPLNIYNRIPFMTIDNFVVSAPNFMSIDYLRMLTDPLISLWRIGKDLKSFKRFQLMLKYYPLPYIGSKYSSETNKIKLNDLEDLTLDQQKIMDIIFDYISNRESIMVVGFYVYNYFVSYFLNAVNKKPNNKYNYLPNQYFELISTSDNYRNDCLTLIDKLKEFYGNDITVAEYYPFFQFTGHSTHIFYKNELVARIYTNNKKCIPYFVVTARKFNINEQTVHDTKSKIRIGTFPVILMYSMIDMIRARTEQDEVAQSIYFQLTAKLLEIRNNYFNNTKTNFLTPNTLFEEFTAECMGETKQPEREKGERIRERKKKNLRYVFSYSPEDGVQESISWKFSNSSGNEIKNVNHMRLSNTFNLNQNDVEDIEASDISDTDSIV